MRVVVALGLMAIALGGCATTLAVSDTPGQTGAAFPVTTPPTVLPPNAFGPEPSHYFGTGGP